MASMQIKAEDLSVGDMILTPMGRSSEVIAVLPTGPRATFTKFKIHQGWRRAPA